MLSRFNRFAAVLVFAALLPSSGLAQRFWDTPAGGQQVGGAVAMCLNGTNKAVPCSAAAPLQTSGAGGGGGDASAANQTTGNASLSVMDDWDETDRAKVNIIAGQVGVAGGTGVDAATVQRMTLATNVALPAGTNVLGSVGHAAQATGGCTLGKTLSAASTNATSVKGSAGTLCSLTVINTTAVLYYLKFYDKATAATCNSDTVIQTIPIPASTTGAGVAVPVGPYGWAFTLGITFCLTGALADNDNTNAATGVAINYSFK